MVDRKNLYRFPWSKTDNPGGWIEVTDICDMHCPGCYRSQLEGHRSLEDIYRDIDDTAALTNCDYITIAGGEPLGYPHLLEVVAYIAQMKIKPMIISNGLMLTPSLAKDLKRAGLAKIHLHIDSAQNRKNWEGRSEQELNELRQYFADMVYHIKGIQCGFHVTVFRSNLDSISDVVAWCLQNLHKVQHISFIAFRMIRADSRYRLIAEGQFIDPSEWFPDQPNLSEISITSEEMYELVRQSFPDLHASAYLNGTSRHEINKFINVAVIGSKRGRFGLLGARTIELSQVVYHFFNHRYFAFLSRPVVGKKVFLASLFDPAVRKSWRNYSMNIIRHPAILFDRIYIQSIHFQQPNEIDEGTINFCDDCPNMMAYKGELINSCRLDEYRKYGGPIQVIKSIET